MATQLKFEDLQRQKLRAIGAEGIMEIEALPSLEAAQARVLNLLSDLRWHGAKEIINAARQYEGLRRMRELRGKGHAIERCRFGKSGEFYYKLKRKPDSG